MGQDRVKGDGGCECMGAEEGEDEWSSGVGEVVSQDRQGKFWYWKFFAGNKFFILFHFEALGMDFSFLQKCENIFHQKNLMWD